MDDKLGFLVAIAAEPDDASQFQIRRRRRTSWRNAAGDEFSPDVVRAWGYDQELMLLEQDEDFLLDDFEFFPVLLELASDDCCPNQE